MFKDDGETILTAMPERLIEVLQADADANGDAMNAALERIET